MVGSPREIWTNWSIQILVLLSLKLQIALFLFAVIRKRRAHSVLRFLLWLAYQLADYVPTYALGHLSIKGARPIVAFWAPFFVLHLGGPDNITAYSLEDNKLWKRHLLNALLQVLGAGYVLYVHVPSTDALFKLASIFVLVVGAVKYVEKIVALMLGNLDTIRGSVRKQPPAMQMQSNFHPHDQVLRGNSRFSGLDEESVVRRAHSLFHICKRAIVDYQGMGDDLQGQEATPLFGEEVRFWNLMENELSLLYDVLYTKAAVIHTLFGYSVRSASPIVIAASMLLFNFIGKDAHREADVVITYVLYGGALFMETTSLLNALGSSWTFAFLSTTRWRWLRYEFLCSGRWDRFRSVVSNFHHLVRVGRRNTSRRWSRNIGQYNMLHFCTRSESALLGRLAQMLGLGFNEWWNRGHYSWAIEVPNYVPQFISGYMAKVYMEASTINSLGMLRNRWGEEPLIRKGLLHGILKDSLGHEFQECIITWHIGTNIFLAKREWNEEASVDVEAIKVISNYMMFLLVEQPDMLPGLSQDRLYQQTCDNLVKHWRSTDRRHRNDMSICAKLKNMFLLHDDPYSKSRAADREELVETIYHEPESKGLSHSSDPRLPYATKLAKELLRMEKDGWADSVKIVLQVWTDILVYGSNKCSRKAHAEKLTSGGDLITTVWLLAEHLFRLYLEKLVKETENNSSEDGSSV